MGEGDGKVIIILKLHTMLLHHTEELDNDLGARSDENLALSSLLGVIDGIERIIENGSSNHFGGLRFSDRLREMRYLRKPRG